MSIETLISTYGYAAVGVGTFLEGETVLFLAGFAAHRGYLALPWVMVWAFLGTLFGDQFYFYLGRIKGKQALARRPAWQVKSEKVLSLLEHHQVWLILSFRFFYGFRTITPFMIGASNVSPYRFLVLNLVGAAIWTVVIALLGYLFGQTLQAMMGDIHKYELLIFIVIIAAGVLIWCYSLLKRYSNKPE
ncbi:MAG: DedA family protein [Thioalkalispiraceae bacterium]|jgi:membrane protein DedA with SNARE-associated domain